MSSATSTETLRRARAEARIAESPPAAGQEAAGFRPWHFFVVSAMLAATGAVIVTPDNTPENLVLVSLAVLAAGLVGLAFHRTLWPLVAPETQEATAPLGVRTRVALEREKALVLRSIKELEFDRAMGKVAEADFQEMGGRLRARAIGLMKQLDERQKSYRDLIEREVERRLAARGRGAPARGASSKAIAGPACGSCGTRNDSDARFCKSCGQPLGG